MLMDPAFDRMLVGIAHALFINRVHVLRLTEIVRLGIQPDTDGLMDIPPELDDELRHQAMDYVLMCFPEEFHIQIHQHKTDWIRPA